jgi:uncharacterized protein YciU (UPF0263 family)
MAYRIIVAIDVDSDTVEGAYEKVYDHFAKHPEVSWESTDEWYDNVGCEIDIDTLAEVRLDVLNKKLGGI